MNGRHSTGSRAGREVGSPAKSLRGREKGKATTNVGVDRAVASGSAPAQSIVSSGDSVDRTLEEERNALVAEKQAQLQGIFNKHDDMVRELYQMYNYKLMLAYDPQVVKSENTTAFINWKSQYDLIENVSSQAGSSRRTRGTRSEQLSVISHLTSQPPIPSQKSTARASKDKLRADAIQGIITATVGKVHDHGKRTTHDKHAGVEKVSTKDPAAPPAPGIEPKKDRSRGKAQGGRAVLSAIDVDQTGHPAPPSISAPSVRRTRTKDHTAPKSKISTEHTGSKREKAPPEPRPESISITLGRRSTRHRAETGDEPPPKKAKITVEMPLVEEHLNLEPPARTPKFVAKGLKLKGAEVPHQPIPAPPPVSPSPFSKIKRVKLVVRRPPPSYSHHRQRPLPPKHGSSLTKFLGSYKTLGDEEMNEEKTTKRALAEARIRKQEAEFRRQGRFIPGTDVLFGSDPGTLPYDPPKRTTTDTWDDIVKIVTARRAKAPKKPIGQQIAGQIASKIQVYWDAQETKKDKARAQEEKRLRALAKATMKMVITEWKKAVYHVREQERLRSEAEERKRGHEHLDAILDQSGQLLETQQGDLRRARSRSGSMDMDRWGDDEDEDEDEEGTDTGSADEDADEIERATEDVEGEPSVLADEPVEEQSDVEEEIQEEEDEEEEEDIGESTARLLGPLADQSSASASQIFEGEGLTDEVHDADVTTHEPSPQLRTSPTTGTDEVDRTDSRVSILPSSPTQPTEVLSPEREMSKEIDDVSTPETRPPGEDVEDMDGLEDERQTDYVASSRIEMVDADAIETAGYAAVALLESKDEGEKGEEEEEAEEEEEEAEVGNLIPREEEEEEEEEPLEKDEEGLAQTSEPTEPAATRVEQEMGEDKVVDEDQTEEMELQEESSDSHLPDYLQPFAVARVDWNLEEKVKPPLLLRGVLRPYQHSGLEWLASLHSNNLNGILADEMGLGKTIQTISLLAHLACDRGIWGPHLIIVPTSVLLNWEMEFKKFLPGFKVLSYHGTTKRRKELRQGWNDKYHFNVCITSYTLASRDAHIFKRKPWYYMVLDEAHMIKNFKSQRWNILLMFRSFRRLLLTGTPLQNNLTELWALLQFLMSGSNFANLKEFGDWFSNPLEKAIETGSVLDDETMQRVTKLHTVLRPYLLRRLKRDVEKELPSKFEHLVLCPLSKRQRFLYDEFMSRAQTRDDLQSGVYQKIANVLMQLRKVCNHPDLFEVRPIVTSFAMQRSAVADFEIKELLIRRRWFEVEDEKVNLDLLGYRFIDQQDEPLLTAVETRRLSASLQMPHLGDQPGEPPPKDTRTIAGYRRYKAYMREVEEMSYWKHTAYLNELKCSRQPIYSSETISVVRQCYKPLVPLSAVSLRHDYAGLVRPAHRAVLSYAERAGAMMDQVKQFAFVTPSVVALDLPRLALGAHESQLQSLPLEFDEILHPLSVKLQIAFPDPSLLHYDCGKLQQLKNLLQEKKAGGHRILIFTQMTRILDILEIFLNLHGYLYLRLDGATKIEDRQYITERFNADPRIFCFIASSRSGGVGINLTGADTVVFYDSDFNPQMDKQCEDRAHRIGQIRDVHIYRFVSQHTVEESMLRKANQKRSLDDLVIQKGEFDWRAIFADGGDGDATNSAGTALTKALGEFEDVEDARAAALAAREEFAMEGADNDDFGAEASESAPGLRSRSRTVANDGEQTPDVVPAAEMREEEVEMGEEEAEYDQDGEEGGTIVDYMLTVVQREYGDFFKDWRL
ncbi:hypothetical protein D9756_005695 [Leucocoprinus leucothites]|uniref:Helicase SWR1 n=1 Tax=Leucocoprinus leucothites TaxID=201217 RepID=A0A8H5D7P3_9AGAR|nr:hypothetical protein D9756_005695 [Leucoagaricus leucothites]